MGEGRRGGRRVGRRELRNQNCCWRWVVPGEVNAREGRGGLAGFTLAVGCVEGAGSSSPLQLTPLLQGEKRKWVWGSM